jgi:predicted alpha/beta-fold hydrolase
LGTFKRDINIFSYKLLDRGDLLLQGLIMHLEKKTELAKASFSLKDEFQPYSLIANRHLQTLLGSLTDSSPPEFPSKEVVLPVTDGDSILVLDSKPVSWNPGKPIVILVHGLTGSHRSSHVVRVGERLYRRGCRVIRMNQRGAGPGLHLARWSYHAGRSEDIRKVMEHFQNVIDPSPIFLVGFSLGGNLILKTAGESGELHGLAGVAAMGPPINLLQCSKLIGKQENRIYEKHFLSYLLQEAKKRQRYFPDLPPLKFPSNMSIRLFDEHYTAPRAGYDCAEHYYEECSSERFIKNINVPTLILTSRDDPFISVGPFEKLKAPDCVTISIQNRGGHLGFLGPDGKGGIRWGESKLVHWVDQHLYPHL